MAAGTVFALPNPTPTRPCPSPTTTRALKLNLRPPLTTLATRRISTTLSWSSEPPSRSRPRSRGRGRPSSLCLVVLPPPRAPPRLSMPPPRLVPEGPCPLLRSPLGRPNSYPPKTRVRQPARPPQAPQPGRDTCSPHGRRPRPRCPP